MLCSLTYFFKHFYFTLATVYIFYYCFIFQCTHRPFASLSIICEWIIHFLPQSPVKQQLFASYSDFIYLVCICGVTGAKLWCHVSNYTELRPIDHVTSRSQICLLQASNCLDRIHHIQILYQPLCVYTHTRAHAIKCIVHLEV